MSPLISVIIPIYKVEAYLDKCIQSVVEQTYQNLEIILIDDGSPDDCPQMCDKWAKKDKRIIVVHQENKGIACTRNTGLDICTGDYIMFVDSDDYIPLNAIEIMFNRMERDQSDFAVSQCTKVYADETQSSPAYFWLSDKVISQNVALEMMSSDRALPVYVWGKLYSRHLFEKLRFHSLKCGEDVYILPDIIGQSEKISLIGSSLYFYYQRDNSIVHTKNLPQILDSMKASLKLSRYLFERDYRQGASQYYYAAVREYWKTERSIEAKGLLKEAFNTKELKILRKSVDKRTIKILMIARFPLLYKFYKFLKNR